MRFLERSLQFIFASVLPTINTALVMILRKGKTHLRPVSPRRPASDAQVHSGLGELPVPSRGPHPGTGAGTEGGGTDRQVAATKAQALGLGTPSWSRPTAGGGRSATLAPRSHLAQRTAASSQRASHPHRRVSGPESAAPPSAPHHLPDTTPHLRPRSTPHLSEPRPASP